MGERENTEFWGDEGAAEMENMPRNEGELGTGGSLRRGMLLLPLVVSAGAAEESIGEGVDARGVWRAMSLSLRGVLAVVVIYTIAPPPVMLNGGCC